MSDGGFVVAWQGPDASGAGIYKQQYNAFGIAVGMETRVNTTTAADQSNPCVALLADGGYVIAWDSMVTGGYDIFFQRYDASGNAMGQETDVGAVSNLYSNPPSVTGLSDGGFALAFDLVVDGKSAAVVQRYDDESTLIGPGIVLGRTATDYTSGVYTGGMQESPSVSALADGGFIATWATDDIVSGYTTLGIHSTIFAAALSTSGSQVLYGTSGADVMDGGSGADVMYGGQGDDVYVVDNIGDVIGENPGEGEDTVESYISYTLGDNVENLTLMGSAGLSGTGNELANTIIGNNGANTLTGGDGNDYIDGGKGNDILDGGNKNDTLEGGDGDDTIYASAGGDTVDGGAGFDWYDASTLSSGLTISLASGRVSGAGMSAELSSIEKVNGTSGNDIITGSANADVLRGNLGDDIIDGGTGDDHLFGDGGTNTASYASATAAVTVSLALQNSDQDTIGAGTDYLNGFANLTGSKYNDTLTGDNNNNLLDGGAGADVMKGGLGDDTYVVGNAYDNVGERLNEGTDTVLSSITYTLTSNVENLTLTGTADINAIGNSINNTLYGNAGNNLLDGAAGADKMYGGLGNDTYVVNNSFDQANENANEGTDTVQSSITFTLGGPMSKT
ncbi:MAG: calcium-binding protein [Asticcacaulis sp.]